MEHISAIDPQHYVHVFRPAGNVVANEAPAMLEQFKSELSQVGDGTALLDLREVTAVDSMGISLVVGLFKEISSGGGHLEVVMCEESVVRVFQMMHLERLMTCYRLVS